MSIVQRHAARGPTIRDLIEICNELGISAHDVREVVRQVGGNVMEASVHLGHSVYDAFVEVAERYNEEQRQLARPSENQPVNVQPQSNLPAEEQIMSKRAKTDGLHHQQGHVGDGNEDDGGNPATETTLDPIRHIWTRFPNSQTARLKWIYTQLIGNNANNLVYAPSGSAWDQQAKRDVATANTYAAAMGGIESAVPTIDMKTPKLIKYRMTSPYSIVASDTAVTNLSEPEWIGYFDSMYQYYHVIKAHWTLSFTIGAAGTTNNMTNPNYRFYVYWKYTSYDDPPTQFTVDLTGKTTYDSVTQNLTPDDYDRMGGWNKILVCQNSTHDVTRVITGTYNHGDCGMDIKMVGTDTAHSSAAATAEGWVTAKVVAPFPENLSVILVTDNAIEVATGVGANIGIRSEIDYTIQFKDLVSKYKFPTQSQVIGGTQDIGQYFFRGAGQLNPSSATATAAVGTYN